MVIGNKHDEKERLEGIKTGGINFAKTKREIMLFVSEKGLDMRYQEKGTKTDFKIS